MDILNYFHQAHVLGQRPALLEFAHPYTQTPMRICGINPRMSLLVRDNILFKNGLAVGRAIDLFDHLVVPPSTNFFPAFIGYVSYEFAHYAGFATSAAPRRFPDAFFQYYEEGVISYHSDDSEKFQAPATTTLRSSLTKHQFVDVVKTIKQKIREGDVYQVNFSLPFHVRMSDNDMLPLYSALRRYNPSSFMGIFHHDEHWIISGSPERLFHFHNDRLTTRPIAGTKPRHHDPVRDDENAQDLRACPKENAEHVMLVDLLRNDMNKVCETNSVVVTEDRSVEFYSHVMHLVSELRGTTRASLKDIFLALFPGGTITGAPKSSVTQTIADLENHARGPYTGALGYVSGALGADFNILIRSVYKHRDHVVINTGAGIVIDSDEHSEWAEVNRKASALKDIVEHRQEAKPKREHERGTTLIHRATTQVSRRARVLFIENHDSFSFNIIDALKTFGATLTVTHEIPTTGLHEFSYVIIGPGPGNPENMPHLSMIIQSAIEHRRALLGICLGHQAIGHYFHAGIKRLPQPVHGKVSTIHHAKRNLFADLSSPKNFARYHSLALCGVPSSFVLDAWSEDDAIMAISHRELPIYGLQFHPESYLSHDGSSLLQKFLQLGYDSATMR